MLLGLASSFSIVRPTSFYPREKSWCWWPGIGFLVVTTKHCHDSHEGEWEFLLIPHSGWAWFWFGWQKGCTHCLFLSIINDLVFPTFPKVTNNYRSPRFSHSCISPVFSNSSVMYFFHSSFLTGPLLGSHTLKHLFSHLSPKIECMTLEVIPEGWSKFPSEWIVGCQTVGAPSVENLWQRAKISLSQVVASAEEKSPANTDSCSAKEKKSWWHIHMHIYLTAKILYVKYVNGDKNHSYSKVEVVEGLREFSLLKRISRHT